MKKIAEIDVKINHIMHEIIELKKALIPLKFNDKEKNNQAWNDLMAASDKITELWQGKSAVEEIRDQREKVW
jgi:predicted  nucleic acid-binding Zn-ribbon protein